MLPPEPNGALLVKWPFTEVIFEEETEAGGRA